MKKITIFFLSCFIISSVSATSFKGLVTNAYTIVKNMIKRAIFSTKGTNFQKMFFTLSSKKNNNSMHKKNFGKNMDTFKKKMILKKQ